MPVNAPARHQPHRGPNRFGVTGLTSKIPSAQRVQMAVDGAEIVRVTSGLPVLAARR